MKKLNIFGLIMALLFLMVACSDPDEQTPLVESNENDDLVQISEQEALAVGIPSQEVAKFNHHQNFRTRMKGDFEVPPVATEAMGISLFRYTHDSSGIYFVVGVNHIQDVTAAHIHLAPPGENGPVVVPLFMGPVREGNFAGILNRGLITADQLTGPLAGMTIPDLVMEMEMGNTYVNVHTEANPGGEIRGQIR